MNQPLKFKRMGMMRKSLYKDVSDYCNLEFEDKQGHVWRCCAFTNTHRWDELFSKGPGTWITGYKVHDLKKRIIDGSSCPIILEEGQSHGR